MLDSKIVSKRVENQEVVCPECKGAMSPYLGKDFRCFKCGIVLTMKQALKSKNRRQDRASRLVEELKRNGKVVLSR